MIEQSSPEYISNLFGNIKAKCTRENVPYSAMIELSRNCNFECIHCYNSPLQNFPELTITQWKKIIDELVDLGCLSITFTGGEAVYYRDFKELWKYCFKKGMLLTLFTNGLVIDKYLDFLEKYPPYVIEMTLYGFSEETYRKVVQRVRSFERVLENIDKIRDRGFNIILKSMALKQNAHDIIKMKEYAEKKGISYAFDPFVHPSKYGEDMSHTHMDVKDVMPLLKAAKDDKEEVRQFMEIVNKSREDHVPSKKMFDCGAGKAFAFIDYQGNVQPCSSTVIPGTSLFDRSIHEIMKDSFRPFMDQETDDESAIDCRNCEDIMFCSWCGATETNSLIDKDAVKKWKTQICAVAKTRRLHFEQILEEDG